LRSCHQAYIAKRRVLEFAHRHDQITNCEGISSKTFRPNIGRIYGLLIPSNPPLLLSGFEPIVLEIEPIIRAGLSLIANDRERNIRCLISCSINRENLVIGFDPRGFHGEKKPAPQNIGIIDRPRNSADPEMT
jgi:hypothetical protein